MSDSAVTYSQMFSGKRLLIVEDEYFLSEKARGKLRELGIFLIGPVGKAEDALELIEGKKADAVILDLHLDAGFVFPIVETLQRLKLPYIFAIGHHPPIVRTRFTGFILCEKAVEIEHIAKALFGRQKRKLYLV
ncbi:response regulator (plasmid) [Rhizobium sp. CB3060]|uniref:response regulator n=1 Tax=unclassified Rhizobium TaxID=2613769 RepID=UPI0021A75A74|nr:MULTISPECIES: response regulator [Rhizobium]MDK4742329.1 response regulator [Rhizobium sp. CNPSo 3464]UWU23682.1 response regulator [Rhizobium tropici]